MRRWNGWGDENTHYPLPSGGEEFLRGLVGVGSITPDATLAETVRTVPASRLPPQLGVSTNAEDRLRHARGQSLPDWVALKSGAVGPFPDGVSLPANAQEVRTLLAYAKKVNAVVVPYGGGTSVAGHINPEAGDRPILTMDMGRMNRLLDLDDMSMLARFGAGTPGPEVERQLQDHGYTLGHFPQSWELSTIGGWVVTRSSGQQSLRYGRIEQLFAGGRMETPSGTLEVRTVPASSAGPDIREMVLGSEGRLGVMTDVSVRVSRKPEHESFHVIFFRSWDEAVESVRDLAQSRAQLSMARVSNARETETMLALAGHPRAIGALGAALSFKGVRGEKCMFTFAVTGDESASKQTVKAVREKCSRKGGVYVGTYLGKRWEHNRFRAPYLRETLWGRGYAIDTLETAVDWSRVDETVRDVEAALRDALRSESERVHVFTHISHVYSEGSSLYTTYIFRLGLTPEHTLDRWRRLKTAASNAIVERRGTISHQHGVGVDHAPFLAAEKGKLGMAMISAVLREIDPDGMMNPGKLIR